MTETEQFDSHKHQRIERLLDQKQQILRLIATGFPLAKIFDALAQVIIDLFPPSLCVIMVYDEQNDCLNVSAAPDVDKDLLQLLDGASIGPDLSSFSAAAFYLETVIVTDIAKDETCGKTRELALRAGYKSCWAHPILSPNGHLLGVIGYLAQVMTDKRKMCFRWRNPF